MRIVFLVMSVALLAGCGRDAPEVQEPVPEAPPPFVDEPDNGYLPDNVDDPEDADALTRLLNSLQAAMREGDRQAIVDHFYFPLAADGRAIDQAAFQAYYLRYFISGTFRDAVVGASPDEIMPSDASAGAYELVALVVTPIELESGEVHHAESALTLYFDSTADGEYRISGLDFTG